MTRYSLVLLCALLISLTTRGQQLRPGFDVEEYKEMIRVGADHYDSARRGTIGYATRFKRFYRSPIVGLDNRFDLWMSANGVVLLSIRGTTLKNVSWLENFYAAMVPAQGTLTMPDKSTFSYKLADNERASVHVGWLLGMASLAQVMQPKLDSLYRSGCRALIVAGHSQGGAIAFLMTAHLRNLQRTGILPADLQLKTYCSAGPKPGNLYFAYDYEADRQQGWAYNVVNTADWVPETPMSVQTVDDFNKTNPFGHLQAGIRKQPLGKPLVYSYAFNKLDKPLREAVRNYQKYLGTYLGKYISKQLPDFRHPGFRLGNDYARCGPTIVLKADSAYYSKYPDSEAQEKVFVHHFFGPYMYLAERFPSAQ